MGSAAHITTAIDASLARLQTDYIDLYNYHYPDGKTPIDETLIALHGLVLSGKVRWIGCSNFDADQLAHADKIARDLGISRFVLVQNQYSLLHRNADTDSFHFAVSLRLGSSLTFHSQAVF